MLEYIKKRKIILAIILVIGIIGWNIYNLNNDYNYEELNEIEVSSENISEETITDDEEIVIHITGEVKKPGIVKAGKESRIADIIEAAGGLTEKADITKVNLAYIVSDGIKIRIPSVDDELEENYITEDAGENIIISTENTSNKIGLVNINTATQTELEVLPGIGPSLAGNIISYREQNGKFKNVEEIKNVTGIGNSKYEKIKDFIKV